MIVDIKAETKKTRKKKQIHVTPLVGGLTKGRVKCRPMKGKSNQAMWDDLMLDTFAGG